MDIYDPLTCIHHSFFPLVWHATLHGSNARLYLPIRRNKRVIFFRDYETPTVFVNGTKVGAPARKYRGNWFFRLHGYSKLERRIWLRVSPIFRSGFEIETRLTHAQFDFFENTICRSRQPNWRVRRVGRVSALSLQSQFNLSKPNSYGCLGKVDPFIGDEFNYDPRNNEKK